MRAITTGMVALVAFAMGVMTVIPTVNQTGSLGPLLSTGDKDRDRIADSLERELCSRALLRDQLKANGIGRCASSTDYLPPQERHITFLYTGVLPGPDADGDGFPASATLTAQNLYIDPFNADTAPVRLAPATEKVPVAIDPNDQDASVPVLTKITSPTELPTDREVGADKDLDGFPSYIALKWAKLTVDRTDGSTTFAPAHQTRVPIDQWDDNADMPVVSTLMLKIPSQAMHGADADHDLLPSGLSITYERYAVDRGSSGFVRYDGRVTEHTVLDADESNRDNVAPLSVVDEDVDFFPDAAEEAMCRVQSDLTAEDGKCVRDDGTGEDGSGTNYVPPWARPDPWSTQP